MSKVLKLPLKYENTENLSDEELTTLKYFKEIMAKMDTPTTPCIIVYGDTNLNDFELSEEN